MARKILVTDYAWADLDIEREILSPIDVELVDAPDGEEDTLAGLADGVCGILTCWAQTTRKVIEAAIPDLEVIVRYGVGLDNIDVAFATEQGIPVAYVPDYCMVDVAEHTMALLLSLSRKTVKFDRTVREGMWSIQEGLPLNRLTGRTLGLIGFGRIAPEVARRAKGFGLKVVAYSPSLTPDRAGAAGVEAVTLDELLRGSDFVSVHCPSNDETRGLVGTEALGKMKETAFLINTSRGEVLDEAAVADALREGRIAGAALDVRCQEPPADGDELIPLDRIINTPHTAFYSTESLIELRERAANEARRVFEGKDPENLVNPEYRGV